MRRLICLLVFASLALAAQPTFALNAGTDVIVPAAARVATWVTDLYVLNPGSQSATVTIYWMVRNQANPNPENVVYVLAPGESLVLPDVINQEFGLTEGEGAFRVVATAPVAVNARIYNQQSGVTFGQGFEGVPRAQAIVAGGTTDIVGLEENSSFRSNVVVMDASGSGCQVAMTLRNASGATVATRTYTLDGFEPALERLTRFPGVTTLDAGSLHAEVISGSAIVVGSKVDNDPATGDPTTLEGTFPSGGGIDGTYQLAIYDSALYATGGNLVIDGDDVTSLNATYTNWDKGDPLNPDCTLIFRWGGPDLGQHTLSEYTQGVGFQQSFTDSGTLAFTITFAVSGNQSITGTIAAVGSGFSGTESGCNGTFPALQLRGGKS